MSTTLRKLVLASAALSAACGGSASPTDPASAGSPSSASSPAAPTATPTPTPNSAPAATPGAHRHRHCGWIGADTAEAGAASFLANIAFFDAIHPKWFHVADASGTPVPASITDDGTLMAAAHAHDVQVIPLIDIDDTSYLRAIIASPQSIATHAAALAQLVESKGYDGIELDYEHLWTAADRPGFVSLVEQTAALLHAKGKVLTLALPAQDHDDGNSAYDYTALAASADVLHLMGYDFHYLGGPHLGPIAPKGWIEDVVTRVESLGSPQKFVLGIANYGIGSGFYGASGDLLAKCNAGSYSSATDHMLTCSLGHQEAGLAPHCTTPQGDAWFEDGASAAEKAQLAASHGLGGVSYWTLGGEPSGFFDGLSAAFP